MAMKEVPDRLMIVSYVSQYHEVFKNETPGILLQCILLPLLLEYCNMTCLVSAMNSKPWIVHFKLSFGHHTSDSPYKEMSAVLLYILNVSLVIKSSVGQNG